MANTDTDEKSKYPAESFLKIYHIASPTISEEISQEIQKYQGSDGFHLEHRWDHNIRQIIQHHRQTVKPGGPYHPDLIMIIDRADVSAEGVLILNLEYHGHVDAIRRDITEAGDIIQSLSILNTDWCEERSGYSKKNKFIPKDHFAMYNLLPNPTTTTTTTTTADDDDERHPFDAALKLMNEGLSSPDLETDDDDRDTYTILAHPREFYRPIKTNIKDTVDPIIAIHKNYAREYQLDPSMFAAVDSGWEDKGILFIKLMQGKEVDSFRHKGYTAGEMLNWMFVGLMSWDEAKGWDPTAVVSSSSS